MKIIVVCTGNTCRSPMAEALMKKKFPNEDIISRGLFVALASGPAQNAFKIIQEMGMDISEHISCQLDKNEVLEADKLFTMTGVQRDEILSIVPEAEGKVYTLSEFVGLEGDILDPFGGDIEIYRECAKAINKCIEEMEI